MYILVTALLGALILLLFYIKTSQKLHYWRDRNFPYAKTTVFQLLRKTSIFVFRLKSIDAVVKDMYDSGEGLKYFGQIGLHKNEIVLRDPDIVYNVMIKDFSYFMDRPFPVDEKNDPLSAHLFGLKGDRWRALRYKLAPTFTTGKLRTMFKQLAESSDAIVDYISHKRESLDAKQLVYSYTLDIIASVAFGMKVDAHKYLDGEKSEFVDMSLRFFQMTNRRFFKFIMITFFERFSKAVGITLTEDDVKAFFFALVKDIIAHRKDTGRKSNDFLQLMINIKEQDEKHGAKAGEIKKEILTNHEEDDKELFENLDTGKKGALHFEMTDAHLAANTFIFISGGSETTATALTFALLELSCNTAVQLKLQDEIDSALIDQDLSFATVNSMTYLNQVVLEVLRKHPPISLMNRHCVQDYHIPGTDHVIRKGDEIVIPTSSIQNDPENFPDPEVFNPDRFQDPDSIRKGTFLPFGMGPRFCIGEFLSFRYIC
ncbi:probable cytochrome P450 6a14 [Nilaparvata lugens]|uniref:probable cytochrome P450 6a14 n=1 Tax=Nilaparvata lugens TaxID=108931 RepID=UPI00193E20A8|nr:probable cytochrome P450 6a14 [Nilaparvata lugens]